MAHASFGTFLFGKVFGHWQTFQEYSRSEEGRYNDHDVHLNKPKSEYNGPGLIELDISMVLNSAWCGDIRPIISQLHAYHRGSFGASPLAAPLILGGKPA